MSRLHPHLTVSSKTGTPPKWPGFTLIELLVTISIVAVMLTVAIPSYRTFLLNSRLSTQSNDLVMTLAHAKSEAVKRGVRVTVCSRSTDTACAASTTWDSGWLAFVDNDGDGVIDDVDQVLQVRAPLENGNTLRAGEVRTHITFQSTGFSPGHNVTLNLCDIRGTADGRRIIISNQGRASTQAGASECP